MLVDRYIAILLKVAGKERSTAYKAIALAEGGIIFLGLIPWLLIRGLEPFSRRIEFHWPPLIEKSLVIIGLSFGLFFILWAVWVQLYIGKGTPNLAAPTQKLIIKGPYKLCRNPLQLGVMFYYLGLGSWAVNGTDGFLSFIVALVCGSLYHRFVEEKELRCRFGDEYENYRRKTPFLIPWIW